MNATLKKIQNQKTKELLESHKILITKYFQNKKDLRHTTVKAILKYYDTQINRDNIEQVYAMPIQLFLTKLLT